MNNVFQFIEGFTPEEIKSKSRKDELVQARKEIAFQLYKNGTPQGTIGKMLQRSQQNISHYIKTY